MTDSTTIARVVAQPGAREALLAMSGYWASLPDSSTLLDPIRRRGLLEATQHRAGRHSYRLTAPGLRARVRALLAETGEGR